MHVCVIMRKGTKILFFCCLVSLMTSCITARRVNYFQEPNRRIPTYADTLSYEDYKIRTNDRLYIRVYSTDETTNQIFNGGMGNNNNYLLNSSTQGGYMDLYTYKVNDQGQIRMPMIGMVSVVDKSARETKELLEKELSQVIQNPYVEVMLVQRTFSVIGATGEGLITIPKEKLTIFEALAMAGDISEFGNRSKVRIIRQLPNGQTVVKTFDIRSKEIVNSEFYYVEPDDVIYVSMLNEQVFGLNSIGAVVSTVASTLSFAVFIYSLVKSFVK